MENNNKAFYWLYAPAVLFLAVLPLNHTMALRLTALFLTAIVALRIFIKNGAPILPLKLPLALWAGMALLSLTWSVDPVFSLTEIKVEIGYGMLTFFSFFVLTRDPGAWKILQRALLAGLAGTFLLVAVKAYQLGHAPSGNDWDWQHGYVSYSTYLIIAMPFLSLSLLGALDNKARTIAWALLPIYLGVAYLTANRMFWVSFCLVFVIFLAGTWHKMTDANARRKLLMAGVAGIILTGITFFSVMQMKAPEAAMSGTTVATTFGDSERYIIWQYWLDRVAERPLGGVGFGRDLPHLVYIKPVEWPPFWFAHGHNMFLNYALQLGIPGVMVFLFLLGAMGRLFWRAYRSDDKKIGLAGLAGLALLVAFISKNMTDDLFWRTDALFFWTAAGILIGYIQQTGKK
ncbi:MAG: O-antigen ligase family protein [Sulfuricella denitrificans]|nr:O-antigen ligase family protein [Sulfuricella denitrificans]